MGIEHVQFLGGFEIVRVLVQPLQEFRAITHTTPAASVRLRLRVAWLKSLTRHSGQAHHFVSSDSSCVAWSTKKRRQRPHCRGRGGPENGRSVITSSLDEPNECSLEKSGVDMDAPLACAQERRRACFGATPAKTAEAFRTRRPYQGVNRKDTPASASAWRVNATDSSRSSTRRNYLTW